MENTYLATFQALGALGLLLGTVGLGAVLARNVLERRREIGLLRAVGYSPADIRGMVLSEGLALVTGGLVAGRRLRDRRDPAGAARSRAGAAARQPWRIARRGRWSPERSRRCSRFGSRQQPGRRGNQVGVDAQMRIRRTVWSDMDQTIMSCIVLRHVDSRWPTV